MHDAHKRLKASSGVLNPDSPLAATVNTDRIYADAYTEDFA